MFALEIIFTYSIVLGDRMKTNITSLKVLNNIKKNLTQNELKCSSDDSFYKDTKGLSKITLQEIKTIFMDPTK